MQDLFGVPGETGTFFLAGFSRTFLNVNFPSVVLPLVDWIQAGDFSEPESFRFLDGRVSTAGDFRHWFGEGDEMILNGRRAGKIIIISI